MRSNKLASDGCECTINTDTVTHVSYLILSIIVRVLVNCKKTLTLA